MANLVSRRCSPCSRPEAASRPVPREQSVPAPRPCRLGPGARGRVPVQAASRAARPGTMEASAVAVTGRCAPRPARAHLVSAAAAPSAPPGPGSPPGRPRGKAPSGSNPRPRARAPEAPARRRPVGPAAAVRAPGCLQAPALQAAARGELGARAGTGLHAALQARREHARTKARGPQTGKVRGGLGAYACLPDEGGGGHTRRDTWERQTPLGGTARNVLRTDYAQPEPSFTDHTLHVHKTTAQKTKMKLGVQNQGTVGNLVHTSKPWNSGR